MNKFAINSQWQTPAGYIVTVTKREDLPHTQSYITFRFKDFPQSFTVMTEDECREFTPVPQH